MLKEPKPNEIVHLCQLITGDRFYLKSDNKKEVWELRFHTLIRIRSGFKKFSQCKSDSGEVVRHDANRIAIFLRRTKPVIKRVREFSIDKYFA
jgi:hypothetical protein